MIRDYIKNPGSDFKPECYTAWQSVISVGVGALLAVGMCAMCWVWKDDNNQRTKG